MSLLKKHKKEIGRLFDRGYDIFGSPENVNEWLTSPIVALDNTMPLSHLDTDEGVESVRTVLTRLEWGVYS